MIYIYIYIDSHSFFSGSFSIFPFVGFLVAKKNAGRPWDPSNSVPDLPLETVQSPMKVETVF